MHTFGCKVDVARRAGACGTSSLAFEMYTRGTPRPFTALVDFTRHQEFARARDGLTALRSSEIPCLPVLTARHSTCLVRRASIHGEGGAVLTVPRATQAWMYLPDGTGEEGRLPRFSASLLWMYFNLTRIGIRGEGSDRVHAEVLDS